VVRTRIKFAAGVSFCLVIISTLSPTHAATKAVIKAGTACSPAGKSIFQNKLTYVCTKKSNKLLWVIKPSSPVINPIKLIYAADLHGDISGATSQKLNTGVTGSQVTAMPAPGFEFDQWSDGNTNPNRSDVALKDSIFVAHFKQKIIVNPTPTPTPTPSPSATYLWAEEFNDAKGTFPASSRWTPLIGNGYSQLGFYNYGTGEIEANTSSAAQTDGSGNLEITTTKANGVWSSSRIWTQGKVNFKYGKLEVRIKLPAGNFNWPAFWMLGSNYRFPNGIAGTVSWPTSGEIDILEGLAGNSVAQTTLHGNYPNTTSDWLGGAGLTTVIPITEDLSLNFHTITMLWTPGLIIYNLDGIEYARYQHSGNLIQVTQNGATSNFDSGGVWPFDNPFFLIIDNAIPAGTIAPDGSTSSTLIDWIHYSTYEGYGSVILN
jgi:beta-glucanase (GH16 family)